VKIPDFLQATHSESYAALLKSVLSGGRAYRYSFMPLDDYAAVADLRERNRIYWYELLERAHWSAFSSLLRADRWFDAMLVAAGAPNFLAFAAAFRGLLESAADSRYALGDVPEMLASVYPMARRAAAGTLGDIILVAPDLENSLIHFTHAAKIPKGATAPPEHSAKTMREYLIALQGAPEGPLHECYATLCNVTHPAADSVLYFYDRDGPGTARLQPDADEVAITEMAQGGGTVVAYCLSETLVYATVVLKLVNGFGIEELQTPAADAVSTDHVELWQQVRKAIETPT
jgi:hypothetical protein